MKEAGRAGEDEAIRGSGAECACGASPATDGQGAARRVAEQSEVKGERIAQAAAEIEDGVPGQGETAERLTDGVTTHRQRAAVQCDRGGIAHLRAAGA